jgi:hypothetical protein
MHQTDNRLQTKLPHRLPSLIGPPPGRAIESVGGDAFPEKGIAKRVQAEVGEPFEIRDPIGVAGAFELIEVSLADAIDRAFDATPQRGASVFPDR